MLFAGAGLAGLAVMLLAPGTVARYLSADGQLTPAATEWLWTYRGYAAASAIILLGAGVAVVACRRALEPALARHADLGRKLGLSALSLIVALALGEIVLRLLPAGSEGIAAGNTGEYADYHRGFHAAIRDQMDARGYRGALRPIPDGAARILVIGDSMVFGYGLTDIDDTFGAQLEARLGSPARPVAVLNAGKPGADTVEDLAIFEELVDVMEPDVVVLAYCINDAVDRPLKREYFASRRWLPLISDNLGRWSELFRRSESAWMTAAERFGWRAGWTDTIASLYEPHSDRMARHRSDIARFVAAVRERDLPLIVVIFPFFERLEDYPLTRAHATVGRVFAELGVPGYDLLEDFAGSDARLWHVAPHDHHPNAAAQARAAEAFATFLKTQAVLPDEP